MDDRTARAIRMAARRIAEADGLLITAGAGMGVDSGLPDFRSPEGFWRAYPALGKLGIPFQEMAQPQWFTERPEMAWAFYGHRQRLYRETKPHLGFSMLLDWARAMPLGYFVVTSNVDGQFEKAGFPAERILEQHGSIHRLQCSRPCTERIWLEDTSQLDVDLGTITARGRLPRCPECGAVARPNVLMFADPAWLAKATREQELRYRQWLATVRGRRLVVVELGAGTAIATIRGLGERLVGERERVTLLRVNPDAAESDEPVIPVRLGALEALRAIADKLPEAFKAAARAGTLGVRPTASRLPMGLRSGLEPVEAQGLEILEFDEAPVRSPGPPAWQAAAAGPNDLRAVRLLDLATGQVQPFNQAGITTAELRVCAERWYESGQVAFAPLPEVGGYVESGFTFRGGVRRAADAPEGERPGGALFVIRGPHEEPVLTVGVARQPIEGAFVWRHLYEHARVQLQPMEHPRAPWVAHRLEPAADKYAAMLPEIREVATRLAWMWLVVQAQASLEGEDADESE